MENTNNSERKYAVPRSAIFSIIIGILSFILFLTQMIRLGMTTAADFTKLSGSGLRPGQYVQGEITELYTIQFAGNTRALSGSFSKLKSYKSYTAKLSDGSYIRVWVYDHDTINALNDLANGKVESVKLYGQVSQLGSSLNTEWYRKNPEYDQRVIIDSYEIWQTSKHAGRDGLIASVYGMLLAVLIYNFGGRIKEVQSKNHEVPHRARIARDPSAFDLEIEHMHKRLDGYEIRKKKTMFDAKVGIVLLIIGAFIVFQQYVIIFWGGIVMIIVGIKNIFLGIINSGKPLGIKIARTFNIRTIQDMTDADLITLADLEQRKEQLKNK